MGLKVTFELSDKDLRFFRDNMRKAQAAAAEKPEAEVLKQAGELISEVEAADAPGFVQTRVQRLRALIEMVQDPEWKLAQKERRNVVTALAYFAEPNDLIPDSVPGLGYIDDAIMIELVVQELKHEIEAFDDFCRFRREEAARKRSPDVSREEWLDVKRKALHSRMRRRRSSRGGSSSTRTRFRLF